MEFKIVISNPKTGKSYQREIKDPEAIKLRNKKIGDEFEGRLVGLEGYTLKVTGGSDKSGFPMKKGLHKVEKRVLMKGGVGYKAEKGKRKRKRVVGEFTTENIVQINTKIVKKGKKEVEELLGINKEEKVTAKSEEKGKKREGVKKPEVKKPVETPKQEEKEVEGGKEKSQQKNKEEGGK